MLRVFLYAHGGSGNHGCEAIVRSTVQMLEGAEITLISSKPEEDNKYGINRICRVIKETNSITNKATIGFWKAYAALKLRNDYIPMEKLRYRNAFSEIQIGDIAISVGGDNYCYEDADKYVMLHEMMKERGAKTILWGCSIEPAVAKRPEIASDLSKYDLITARETITYNLLKEINPNTYLVVDSAFQLKGREISLPNTIKKKQTVGINLSPMVIKNEQHPGIIMDNYRRLIEFIISGTDLSIALIPHVVWKDGDDRKPLEELYQQYKDTGRVCRVKDTGCEELKYIISNCRFFIGARTHSTIAAYSSGIPTLVLGYSVKSRGIAKDLFGTEEGYVISVHDVKQDTDLLHAFNRIVKNEKQIKDVLSKKKTEWEEALSQTKELVLG